MRWKKMGSELKFAVTSQLNGQIIEAAPAAVKLFYGENGRSPSFALFMTKSDEISRKASKFIQDKKRTLIRRKWSIISGVQKVAVGGRAISRNRGAKVYNECEVNRCEKWNRNWDRFGEAELARHDKAISKLGELSATLFPPFGSRPG